MEAFKDITEQLIEHLKSLEETYLEEGTVERSGPFFRYVKKETEDVFKLLDAWEGTALRLSEEGRAAVFPQQIDATIDNMKALIMHSYYKDVRKRRYMEIQKACDYVFNQSIKG